MKFRKPGQVEPNENAPSMRQQYLAHKDEPHDTYAVHSANDSTVSDGLDCTNNLFDDSPIEDKRWMLMARRFLRHTRRR